MKKVLILPAIVLLILALATTGCSRKSEPDPTLPPGNEVPDPTTTQIQKTDPVTVVINNHSAARPQSGLQQATFVYEFLTEGGITRFLAVYESPVADDVIVGPVRSLRPYFVVQAIEHGGVILNAGYSRRTRDEIRGLNFRDIQSSQYLYRDSSRNAPHNLYTSTDRLFSARGPADVRTYNVSILSPEKPHEVGTEIIVQYGSRNIITYTYDKEKKSYLRYINNNPHTDRESGNQYTAHRVIVRENSHTPVPGTNLVDIDLSGSGSAILYEGGRKYEITWEKTGGEIRYQFADGSPVPFEYGNTWVQVVRP